MTYISLAKILKGPSQSIWDWGTTPHTAKGRVGVGMEGFGVRLCLDSLEWAIKIVGYEKTEFFEIYKWNLRDR